MFENIFQISNNVKYIENNNLISIFSDPYSNVDFNIKIKFLKSSNIDCVIGFSINLKNIKIKLKNDIIKLNKISKINLNIKEGDIIEIIPNKFDRYYEIHIWVKKIIYENLNLQSSINYVNNKNSNLKMDGVKKIIIITTKYIESISKYFQTIFNRKGIECIIKYDLKILDCLKTYNKLDTIYLIIFNNSTHLLLPNRFIFYQIEQIGSFFLTDKEFLAKLKYSCIKAEEVWEYTNLTTYIYSKYCESKLKYIPMPFVYINNDLKNKLDWDEMKYDIFFYGTKNERREKILNKLSEYFNIKIGYGIYGNEKIENIIKSKIILNLHYYENAGLETCRFNEILNYNRIIVSENSPNDNLNTNLYKDVIILFDSANNDLSNINNMIDKIKYHLNYNNYAKKINQNKMFIKKLENNISAYY